MILFKLLNRFRQQQSYSTHNLCKPQGAPITIHSRNNSGKEEDA